MQTHSERKKWNHNFDCRRLVYTHFERENGRKQDKKQSTFWQIYYVRPVLSLNYITESRNRRNVLFCECVCCVLFLFYCVLFHCSDRAHISIYFYLYFIFGSFSCSLTHTFHCSDGCDCVRIKSTRFSSDSVAYGNENYHFLDGCFAFFRSKKGSFTSKIHFIPFHEPNRCLLVGTSSLSS